MAVSSASVIFFLVFLSIASSSSSEAKEILVGGKPDAWAIPDSQQYSQSALSHWAQTTRFRVGDTLVWHYDGAKDSVLEVSKEGFLSCNTTEPLESFNGGETKVQLTRSGAYYFISGAKGHCDKGQKLVLVVLSPRHHHVAAPAPSPSELGSPAVAPTSAAVSGLRGGGLTLAVALLGFGLF